MNKYSKESKTYVLILLAMCLISFGLGYFVFTKFHLREIRHIPIEDSITINVLPLNSENISIKNTYVGHAEAINQVQIIPFVSGYLQKIGVKEGSFVSSGDFLLSINPDEYLAKVDSAKSTVLETKASLDYNENYYNRVKKSKNALTNFS